MPSEVRGFFKHYCSSEVWGEMSYAQSESPGTGRSRTRRSRSPTGLRCKAPPLDYWGHMDAPRNTSQQVYLGFFWQDRENIKSHNRVGNKRAPSEG